MARLPRRSRAHRVPRDRLEIRCSTFERRNGEHAEATVASCAKPASMPCTCAVLARGLQGRARSTTALDSAKGELIAISMRTSCRSRTSCVTSWVTSAIRASPWCNPLGAPSTRSQLAHEHPGVDARRSPHGREPRPFGSVACQLLRHGGIWLRPPSTRRRLAARHAHGNRRLSYRRSSSAGASSTGRRREPAELPEYMSAFRAQQYPWPRARCRRRAICSGACSRLRSRSRSASSCLLAPAFRLPADAVAQRAPAPA